MKNIVDATHGVQESFRIAIIVSVFNESITQALQEGALTHLKNKGFTDHQITIVAVPGAFEIPVVAQRLAKKGIYGAIIALGAVIRGETTHYDYVCEQVSLGCQRVMLDYAIPVIFGVLTTENEEQALTRVGGEHGHKGKDAVDAAVRMVDVVKELTSDKPAAIGF